MLLSSLQFASFLTYAPHGNTSEIITSKKWTQFLKGDQQVKDHHQRIWTMSRYLADLLATRIHQTGLQDFLGSEITLVPVPKSSLLLPKGLWVPQRIATALVEVGLGMEVAEILERSRAVPKAAFCAPKDRPKAIDHYNTMTVRLPLTPLRRIMLIDDVITRGATLLGAGSRIAEAFPHAEIRGFAMIRTISNPENFVTIEAPCVGEIHLRGKETFRKP